MASTVSSILSAVDTVNTALTLTDCEEVAVRAEPKDGDAFYPGITISQKTESEHRGTNERDDIGYPVLITFVVNNDVDPTEDDLFATWRQTIRKAFIHKKLSGVTSVCTCLVEHGPVFQDVPDHLDVGTMVLRFISRETRT